MIYSPPHFDDPQHASIYDGITGWASHARQRWLASIAFAGSVGGAALLLVDWRHVPFAGLLLTGAAVGAWGLIEQRAMVPHSMATTIAQALLVVLGMIAAIVGGFGALFWVMGPAPVL
jgi:hypothetical protein